MATRRSSERRRPATPPSEGILSRVLGELLDPLDALFTIFFSILFALLFTLSYGILINRGIIDLSTSDGYGPELFVTILGAVTAWGIIDGVLYALGEVFARRERYRLLQYIQSSSSDESAIAAIADELDSVLEPITTDDQRGALYQDILRHLEQAEPQAVGLKREDVIGALTMVILSAGAVLPSLLPLLLLDDVTQAIRLSNVISIGVLFVTGYSWGKYSGTNPWKTGLLLSSLCVGMVIVAVLLGG